MWKLLGVFLCVCLSTLIIIALVLHLSASCLIIIAVAVADCGDGGESTNSAGSCQLEPRLDRYQEPGDYNTKFVRLDSNNTVQENEFLLSNTSVTTVPFTVQRTTDVGGTLVVKVAFKKKDVVRFVSIWWYLFDIVSYKYV